MTDREKLFLYHGVLIGSLTDEKGKPPMRFIPFINEVADSHDFSSENADTMREITQAVEDAERRFAEKN